MLIHLSAISLLTLVAFVQASVAQNTSPRVADLLPEGLRVEEIVEDSMRAVVRGSLVQADGTVLRGQVIICERGNPELSSRGQATLIWQDHAARTDDRMIVEADLCVSLVTALRQRKDEQGR